MQLKIQNSKFKTISAFRHIDGSLARVKELIDNELAGCAGEPELRRLLVDVNAHGGKMLRSGLVLLAGLCCGGITDRHIRIAAIVEIIHNATLLHDDVIDEGKKRRGTPTANMVWGNESAVLLGDFLLSRAFRMCADLEPQITTIIADTAVQICRGELRQTIQKRNWQLNESEYIDIITEKSAALFSSACFLGGLLAGADKAQTRSLSSFGRNVGIAFQITDDLLDIIGDENKTGKTLGSDVDKNKLTLAPIHLIRTIDERQKSSLIKKMNTTERGKEALKEMFSRYGSFEYVHNKVSEFTAKAISSLNELQESDAKNALIETAEFVAARAAVSQSA